MKNKSNIMNAYPKYKNIKSRNSCIRETSMHPETKNDNTNKVVFIPNKKQDIKIKTYLEK